MDKKYNYFDKEDNLVSKLTHRHSIAKLQIVVNKIIIQFRKFLEKIKIKKQKLKAVSVNFTQSLFTNFDLNKENKHKKLIEFDSSGYVDFIFKNVSKRLTLCAPAKNKFLVVNSFTNSLFNNAESNVKRNSLLDSNEDGFRFYNSQDIINNNNNIYNTASKINNNIKKKKKKSSSKKKVSRNEESSSNNILLEQEHQPLSIKSLIKEKDNNYFIYEDKIKKLQFNVKIFLGRLDFVKIKDAATKILRTFRRFLILKYKFPDNYYIREKYLKTQSVKFEKVLDENMRILFPMLYTDLLHSNTGNIEEPINTNTIFNVERNLALKPYEAGKINLFAKILDIDSMVYRLNKIILFKFKIETDEIYDAPWAQLFDKLYTNLIKSNTPIQMIALGSCHTVCMNNKGKVYSFGWNNYGQCGLPINCKYIYFKLKLLLLKRKI